MARRLDDHSCGTLRISAIDSNARDRLHRGASPAALDLCRLPGGLLVLISLGIVWLGCAAIFLELADRAPLVEG